MMTPEYIESRIVVIPESGCWIWMQAINEYGYGYCTLKKKTRKAHRVAYTVFRGRIPCGKILRHICDVRCCVNPWHLLLGTQKQNMQDMSMRGRMNPVSLLNLKNATEPKDV